MTTPSRIRLTQHLLTGFLGCEIASDDLTTLTIYEMLDWHTEIRLNKQEVAELIAKLQAAHDMMENS